MQPVNTQALIQFLRSHTVAALATVKEGNIPHIATVYYYVDDKLQLYFLTKDKTAKFTSLKNHIHVSITITDPKTMQTVQMEGQAQEVDYTGAYAPVVKAFLDNLEQNGMPWENLPFNHLIGGYYVFVQVTSSWIRWSDFTNWSSVIKFEEKFQPVSTAQ